MNCKNWITAPIDMGDASCEFRKKFSVEKKVVKAELSVSAMGLFAAYINGKRVGEAVLTPGLTSYKKRVQYHVYDVTELIKKNNELNVVGAPGWAVGEFAWEKNTHTFSDVYAVIFELTMKFSDGSRKTIVSGPSFDVYTSKTEFSSIYHGETVNLNHVSKKLGKAKRISFDTTALVRQVGEDIVEQQRVAPVELIVTPKGERVIDFGQNMTGYVEFKIKGKKGERIRITHAEVLDKDGNFYNANYRNARNEMIYVLDGKEDVFKPRFSFQGFRYIRIEEYPEQEIDLGAISAIVVYSNIKRTGYFKCGNEKINQLYSNSIWGQRGNYLDIPTDCPQRDERMGWTGDAEVFCRTAAINYDVKKFFKKWLGDMALEQRADGAVAGVVPEIYQKGDGIFRTRVSAAWGDAATIIPWELYMAYGDRELLAENFDMMRKWVDYIHSAGPEEYLWLGGKHYGDWLAMDATPDVYMGATPTDFIGSAYFAFSTSLLIKAGKVLGKDMSEYEKLYNNVVKRFREYFMEDGMPKEGVTDVVPNKQQVIVKNMTQTAIVLILHFGLCTEEEKPALIDKLCELIHGFDDRMTTGFVGTPYILHVLTENGRSDVAYKLLTQEKNPSWLFSVNHGATTIWEHWNGIKEDGSFWSTDMNSFNHYAYGAVCDWLFGCACGIKPTSPAYKTVRIAPNPSRVLGSAQYCIDSVNGRIISKWYYRGEDIRYEVEIPTGVEAEIVLPDGKKYNVGGGEYVFYSKA